MASMKHSLLFSLACLSGLGIGQCATPPNTRCKAYPGSSDWPAAHTWAQLNKALGGRLLSPVPPGAVCHPGQPTYDAQKCPSVAKQWSTFEFHVADPVSVMWDQAANYTCLPEKSATCSGGGYPSYVVNATGAEHVKIAVDFARKHNIRLNVKSTGHDYLGRSNAPGTLSIWMHHLNKFTYHAGKYTLGGSGKVLPGNAVTVGGGTLMYDIYAATDKFNQTIVGGGGKTVGISGYVTGGGHGLLAPRYGLAADNVLEMEIVTPGGRIMIANEDQNRDLFWAMRGGGGSTFGVITSITLKTHPTPKIYNISWLVVTDHKAPFLWDMVAYVGSQIPRMMNKGLSGYNLVTTSMPNPIPGSGSPDNIAGFLGTAILQDAQDPGLIQQEIFRPINDTITKRWAGKVTLIQSTIQYDSWLAWFDKNFDSTTAGLSAYLISRLLDENALTRDPKKLAAAWKAGSSASGSMSAFMVGGKGVQEAKPPGGGNAVNPAWRRAYVHALNSRGFEPFNKTSEQETIKILDASFEPFRRLSPQSGAYINEALPYEKNWQQAFWGSNYNRLLKIKRSVDPTDLFWCAPCIGSEGWEKRRDGRLCRRDSASQ